MSKVRTCACYLGTEVWREYCHAIGEYRGRFVAGKASDRHIGPNKFINLNYAARACIVVIFMLQLVVKQLVVASVDEAVKA